MTGRPGGPDDPRGDLLAVAIGAAAAILLVFVIAYWRAKGLDA